VQLIILLTTLLWLNSSLEKLLRFMLVARFAPAMALGMRLASLDSFQHHRTTETAFGKLPAFRALLWTSLIELFVPRITGNEKKHTPTSTQQQNGVSTSN
jgi:hypothetical protein